MNLSFIVFTFVSEMIEINHNFYIRNARDVESSSIGILVIGYITNNNNVMSCISCVGGTGRGTARSAQQSNQSLWHKQPFTKDLLRVNTTQLQLLHVLHKMPRRDPRIFHKRASSFSSSLHQSSDAFCSLSISDPSEIMTKTRKGKTQIWI